MKSVRKIALVFALLFVAPFAFAGPSRVLPAVYDEYTIGSGGYFSTLQAAEDATDNNLVAAGRGVVLTVLPGTYNQKVTVASSTGYVNATYYRVLRAQPGHEREVVLNFTGSTSDFVNSCTVLVAEKYFRIHDIVIQNNSAVAAMAAALVFQDQSAGRVIGCQIGPNGGNAAQYRVGLDCRSTVVTSLYVANCRFTGCSYATLMLDSTQSTSVMYVYNSLFDSPISSGPYGLLEYNAGTIVLKNSIDIGHTYPTSGTVAYGFCVLSTGNGGVTFEADGLHLSASDTVALDHGANLAADAYFPINDDVDGEARPYGTAWDIGPDEYEPTVSSGAGVWCVN